MPFLRIVRCLVLVVLGLYCLGANSPVAALGTTDFKVYPTTYDSTDARTKAWFIEKLAPGQSKSSSISITSTARTSISLILYAVDATTNNGVFALLGQNDPKNSVGAWVSLTKNAVTLSPGQTMAIPFTFSIPSNASVGDHDGGIVVQEATPKPSKLSNGTTINIISRVGTRIYETVPGATNPHLRINSFVVTAGDHKNDTFRATIENTGNVDLQPTGSIIIIGAGHHILKTVSLAPFGSIIPGHTATSQVIIPHTSIWPAWQQAQLTVQYASGQQVTKTVKFFTYQPYDAIIPIAGLGIWQLKKHFVIRRRP